MISAFAASWLQYSLAHAYVVSDSAQLYKGLLRWIDCWSHGHWRAPGVARFPLFQQLTGLAILAVRDDLMFLIRGWVLINLAAIAATVWLLAAALRRRGRAAALAAVVVFLTGPVYWYSDNTFNEPAAGFVTLAFAAAVIFRRTAWQTAALFIVAATTKDIAFVFLLMIWLLGLFTPRRTLARGEIRAHLTAMAIATIVSVAIAAAFNEMRYGVPYGVEYLKPEHLVRPLAWRLNYFLAMWCSPNGGIVFFWPLFAAILLWPSIRLAVKRLARQEPAQTLIAVAGPLGILSLLFYAFSSFYAPFGWWAYGNRYVLPWIPALTLLAFDLSADRCLDVFRVLSRTPRRRLYGGAMLAAISLPHVLIEHRPALAWDFQAPAPERMGYPKELDVVGFYRDNAYHLWRRSSILLDPFPTLLRDRRADVDAVLYVAALAAALAKLRRWLDLEAIDRQPLDRHENAGTVAGDPPDGNRRLSDSEAIDAESIDAKSRPTESSPAPRPTARRD